MHLHRLGERCRCGHVTLPARFYWEVKNEKLVELNQEQAERAYLEHLREHMPERYEKLRRDEIPVTKRNNVTESSRPITRKYKTGAEVRAAVRGRPKKHADHAARQKAYRGRQ